MKQQYELLSDRNFDIIYITIIHHPRAVRREDQQILNRNQDSELLLVFGREELMLCLHVHYCNTTLSLPPPQVGGFFLQGKYILLPITEGFATIFPIMTKLPWVKKEKEDVQRTSSEENFNWFSLLIVKSSPSFFYFNIVRKNIS